MGKKSIKRITINSLPFIFLCLLISFAAVETKNKGEISADGADNNSFNNTIVYSKEQISYLIKKDIPPRVNINPLSDGSIPYCGTVSHHMLVSPVINAWFRELKRLRDIKTFIIISPNHYRSGKSIVSLSFYDWNTAGTVTKVNRSIVRSIMQHLGIKEDNTAFFGEHGIETLLPFINSYFSEAEIVPVLTDEKIKSGDLNAKLADEVCRIMKIHKDVFLLISADFSHRRGRNETDMNDARSLKSLTSLDFRPARPCSDNTAGLMVLYRVCKNTETANTHIFCHTDAEKYTAKDQGNDITSYFFTFQY